MARHGLAYKVENAVDRESAWTASATLHSGNTADSATVIDTAVVAAVNLKEAGWDNEVEAIAVDKGYHPMNVVIPSAEFVMKASFPKCASLAPRR